mmetsp:Transcript_23160/g.74646  ORF Transcript_23160/g.74646 Transcript_23160/m.74646 type:complete len:279 (-) Transcript_23160:207-1043(-)
MVVLPAASRPTMTMRTSFFFPNSLPTTLEKERAPVPSFSNVASGRSRRASSCTTPRAPHRASGAAQNRRLQLACSCQGRSFDVSSSAAFVASCAAFASDPCRRTSKTIEIRAVEGCTTRCVQAGMRPPVSVERARPASTTHSFGCSASLCHSPSRPWTSSALTPLSATTVTIPGSRCAGQGRWVQSPSTVPPEPGRCTSTHSEQSSLPSSSGTQSFAAGIDASYQKTSRSLASSVYGMSRARVALLATRPSTSHACASHSASGRWPLTMSRSCARSPW